MSLDSHYERRLPGVPSSYPATEDRYGYFQIFSIQSNEMTHAPGYYVDKHGPNYKPLYANEKYQGLFGRGLLITGK
ncbi:uncharacterized protein BYT42DRAFT_615863 [Radiomyces spectabilis]|uniref:uncharacterized protein n=1 Tax=Radiomyces spectabilis TaxID=64574 RepID=UPI00221EBBB7|nr:uncharacterized protein BYT42DRAFT_615863 [Radiomyces spectabilis]KAI8374733.1 hypothetical protein BYT42DRAFT_615863 [Radiomyces spectabilis]